MKYSLLLPFLCLPLLAGREPAIQDYHDSLQKIADKYYRLSDLKMSEDGRWLTIRKSYCLTSDTLMVFDSRDPGLPVCYRVNVATILFTGSDNILFKGLQQAELFSPEDQTSICFKGVKQIREIRNNMQFLLHYSEEEKSRLELRENNGELLNVIDNVTRYYTTADDDIFAVTKNEGGISEVVLLKDQTTKTVYTTSRIISSLEPDPGSRGIIISEKNTDNEFIEMQYLDLTTGTIFPLNEVLSLPFHDCLSEVISEGSAYFITIIKNRPETDHSVVDIWYGNDYKLEDKTIPHSQKLCFVWEPKEGRIRQIGDENLTENIYTGNDLHFLSFDPDYFRDYINQRTPMQVYVYDEALNRYSILDTILPELYLSGNGEFALSPGKNGWQLYHIPSAEKKTVSVEGSVRPLFATDGNSVLFEGKGALWKYELNTGILTRIVSFDGGKISIVHYRWEGLGIPGCMFSKTEVDLREPLLIKLSDPQKNETSYLLCHKGKSTVIIPPSTRHIQSFNYSRSLDSFSWIEEDYNLPPRLIHKKLNKDELILFSSNKADTAIMHLKQEIISYTNSDGVQLKGILYYPLHFSPTLTYPMVVHVYQVQSNSVVNRYPVSTFGKPNNDGLDLRLLLENGYFVYFPDIVYSARGTGVSALDCVNQALNAIENRSYIDKKRIGLIGHSHGGYETNFIATHSSRFAAYVSGAGNSDIIRSYFSFNYNFLSPFYWQYENGQYEMNKSFSKAKELYFHNNPIHFVDQVNAPVLLWTGMKDMNIYWEQTMEFYIGLKRNKKKVIALFYPDEAHTINTPDACKDLGSRILSWFNYFLKGDENAEWIETEMKRTPE
jgi:dienelactone hydrolase